MTFDAAGNACPRLCCLSSDSARVTINMISRPFGSGERRQGFLGADRAVARAGHRVAREPGVHFGHLLGTALHQAAK